jgi:outer membrane scaffolding protein for murein synthesis (MipA/OmpV family)
VAPGYATPARPAYAAQSGLLRWRLSASVSRDLTPDLRLFGFAHADTVAGAANTSSPLVQRKSGASVGIGLTYTWMRSENRASD